MQSLLLDSKFRPIGMISWKKAICLLFQNKAETLVSGELTIRSQSQEFTVPAVLRLVAEHVFNKKAALTKKGIFLRDSGKCAYCGDSVTLKTMTVDHVMPRCQGGKDEWKNVVTACFRCNNKKGGKTPQQANMSLLYLPKEPTSLDILFASFKGTELYQKWATNKKHQ